MPRLQSIFKAYYKPYRLLIEERSPEKTTDTVPNSSSFLSMCHVFWYIFWLFKLLARQECQNDVTKYIQNSFKNIWRLKLPYNTYITTKKLTLYNQDLSMTSFYDFFFFYDVARLILCWLIANFFSACWLILLPDDSLKYWIQTKSNVFWK